MSFGKKINDLSFSDLYICLEGGGPAHYRISSSSYDKHPNTILGPEYREDIDKLASLIRAQGHDDCAMIVHEGLRLRAAYFTEANHQKWVALRQIKAKPPALNALGLPPALVPHLQKLGMREGLFLVCGATGQGKTTTGCSLLVDYLERFGGVGITIEDPVEYDISGLHGESGFCHQLEVRRDEDWADSLINSLRCHPRYLFIGEIRTPDIANQLLRAATSGHFVIATMHAGSVFEAFEGLLQLAEQKIGDRAKQLLASSFTGCMHQTLGQHGLTPRFLIADSNNSQSASIRNLIRDSKVGQIASVMDQQYSLLMQTGQLFR